MTNRIGFSRPGRTAKGCGARQSQPAFVCRRVAVPLAHKSCIAKTPGRHRRSVAAAESRAPTCSSRALQRHAGTYVRHAPYNTKEHSSRNAVGLCGIQDSSLTHQRRKDAKGLQVQSETACTGRTISNVDEPDHLEVLRIPELVITMRIPHEAEDIRRNSDDVDADGQDGHTDQRSMLRSVPADDLRRSDHYRRAIP